MGQVATHSEAEQELDEAIAWYEQWRVWGWAGSFATKCWKQWPKLRGIPLRYSARKYEVRRANLKRFPYHVNYLVDGFDVVIVAIAHDPRSPFYWRRRLDKGPH